LDDLVAEHHILRNQLQGRVQLTDAERKTLAEIGHKLGKQALAEVAKLEFQALSGENFR
jgi:putative transposase